MDDRCVWITGASSGIGEALAYELAARGAHLMVSARRESELTRVAERCLELGAASAVAAPVDITDTSSVHEAVAKVDHIDIAVLNAGTWKPMPARRFDADELARQYDVNVVGTARCIEAVLPSMLERRGGRIAIVSSLTAFSGLPLAAAYGSTKAALRSMSESLRADLAGTGVKVTTVYPGFVRTPMTSENRFPMPQIMDADEAASIIARGLARGRTQITFPRRLGYGLKLLGSLPAPLQDRITARMARSQSGMNHHEGEATS